jgi:hypothetical protein
LVLSGDDRVLVENEDVHGTSFPVSNHAKTCDKAWYHEHMKFSVLREAKLDGLVRRRGEVIDLEPTLKTQQLVDLRYILPADDTVASVAGPTDTPKRGRLATKQKD